MPVAQINILEGRTDEQKETLIREVTDAIARSLGSPAENVRVIITEMPKQHFGIGGQSVKGYTDLMVDGAPSPHQSDTTLRWLIDRLRS
ncbi:4-oxalocrotonate tautomerase family enzyme [Marinobacter pelagius]|uniref:Tautomerase n=1 Tax=Marinobacter pelagius TaxID=379482 RepID=A0A366GXD0_9GAMM|nr:4-oxalocrotonate tautomerase family enzyme [Marinobacter pelagius]